MNQYELTVVLSVKLEEEERTAAYEKVKGYVTRFGGNIVSEDDWGRKKLAYEIQKMKEAYYTIITFESEADAPAQIENALRIYEPVIRYLIVKKEA